MPRVICLPLRRAFALHLLRLFSKLKAALAYDAFSREHGLRRPFNVPKSKAEKAMTAAHAAPSNYHGVTWFKAGGKW